MMLHCSTSENEMEKRKRKTLGNKEIYKKNQSKRLKRK